MDLNDLLKEGLEELLKEKYSTMMEEHGDQRTSVHFRDGSKMEAVQVIVYACGFTHYDEDGNILKEGGAEEQFLGIVGPFSHFDLDSAQSLISDNIRSLKEGNR